MLSSSYSTTSSFFATTVSDVIESISRLVNHVLKHNLFTIYTSDNDRRVSYTHSLEVPQRTTNPTPQPSSSTGKVANYRLQSRLILLSKDFYFASLTLFLLPPISTCTPSSPPHPQPLLISKSPTTKTTTPPVENGNGGEINEGRKEGKTTTAERALVFAPPLFIGYNYN